MFHSFNFFCRWIEINRQACKDAAQGTTDYTDKEREVVLLFIYPLIQVPPLFMEVKKYFIIGIKCLILCMYLCDSLMAVSPCVWEYQYKVWAMKCVDQLKL